MSKEAKIIVLDPETDTADVHEVATFDDSVVLDENAVTGLPKKAKFNDDGSVTLRLEFPREIKIKRDGNITTHMYDHFTISRFNGAAIRAMNGLKGHAHTLTMFSKATGISEAVMERLYDLLDAYDVVAAGEVIEYFLKNGRRTGPSS